MRSSCYLCTENNITKFIFTGFHLQLNTNVMAENILEQKESIFKSKSFSGKSKKQQSGIYKFFDNCKNLYKTEYISEEQFEKKQETLQRVTKGKKLHELLHNILQATYKSNNVIEYHGNDIKSTENVNKFTNELTYKKFLKLQSRIKEVLNMVKDSLECKISWRSSFSTINETAIHLIESTIFMRQEQILTLLSSIHLDYRWLREEDNGILDNLITVINELEKCFSTENRMDNHVMISSNLLNIKINNDIESNRHNFNTEYDNKAVHKLAYRKFCKLQTHIKEVFDKVKYTSDYKSSWRNSSRRANIINDEAAIRLIESKIYLRKEEILTLLTSINLDYRYLREEDNDILDRLITVINELENCISIVKVAENPERISNNLLEEKFNNGTESHAHDFNNTENDKAFHELTYNKFSKLQHRIKEVFNKVKDSLDYEINWRNSLKYANVTNDSAILLIESKIFLRQEQILALLKSIQLDYRYLREEDNDILDSLITAIDEIDNCISKEKETDLHKIASNSLEEKLNFNTDTTLSGRDLNNTAVYVLTYGKYCKLQTRIKKLFNRVKDSFEYKFRWRNSSRGTNIINNEAEIQLTESNIYLRQEQILTLLSNIQLDYRYLREEDNDTLDSLNTVIDELENFISTDFEIIIF